MMTATSRLLLPLLVLACALRAQVYILHATTDKPDAQYQPGETITVAVQLLLDPTTKPEDNRPGNPKHAKPVAGVTLDYTIQADGPIWRQGKLVSAIEPVTLTMKLDYPGWTHVVFTPKDKDGKTIRLPRGASRGIGAMVQPEKLAYFGQEPSDFDDFWRSQRQRLDAIPLKPVIRELQLPPAQARSFTLYDFELPCAGDMPVRGHLSVPIDAKTRKLPAVVSFQGAGVYNSGRPLRRGAISIDINAHGILNDQPQEYYDQLRDTSLKGYPQFGKDSRDTSYFLGMYLRVMRVLDFAKSRPEWNGKDLVVIGGSQGGAQSIAAAALDQAVTLCIAGVPALSDHAGSRAVPHRRQPGWPRLYYAEKDGSVSLPNRPVARAAEYFDNVNFARRIHCETYLSTGFIDGVCVPTSVYVVFNTLASTRKFITTTPTAGHNAPNTAGHKRLNELLQPFVDPQAKPNKTP